MEKKYKLLLFSLLTILVGIIVFFVLKLNSDKNYNNILVENENITILNNSDYYFKALCIDENSQLNYESSDTNIFTVDSDGDISALSIGEANLILKCGKAEKLVNIYVTEEETMVTDINIKEENLSIDVGDKYLFEIEIFPSKATYENLQWTSSDNDVAIVNNGYIEAKNDGTATITASLNEIIIDSAIVTVGSGTVENVQSIDFEQEVVTMGLNETYQLVPIFNPINANNKGLIYAVDDESIVDIDENGLIKSKAKGKTKVTIMATNGVSTTIEVKVETSTNDLTINTDEIVIAKGESYQLKSNYVSGIEWYSSNNKVVIVNSDGMIKGISNGEAVITVVNNYGRINTANVTVKGNGVLVNSIVLSKNNVSLKPGGFYKMTAIVLPNNATNKELIWETSDSRIATVADDGTIFALRTGEAVITAYSNNSVYSSVKVNVSATAVTADSLEISPSSMTLLKGDTYMLTANIVPSNTTDKNVVWETTDSSIVSIDQTGKITANKTGNVVITATSNGLISKASVEVKSSIVEITNLSIDEENLNLKVGDTKKLSTSFLPVNASNKNFIWSSSSNCVSVSNSGLVTALSEGTATIKVKSTNGIEDTITVAVTKSESSNTNDNSVSEVLLNLENINLHIGQTKQLKATVLPLNSVNNSLTWISNNESVVTVSSSGLLTGIKPGSAQVSVITENGKVAKTNVIVTKLPIYDSGKKLLELYSDRLIVTMTQDSKTGINKIRVWVADPYKQFHKVDAQNGDTDTVGNIINTAIKTNGLKNTILIGGNAMMTNNRKRIGNIVITEGNAWHYDPGGPNGRDEAKNSLIYVGIAANGYMKVYCTRPDNNCIDGRVNEKVETPLFKDIINDGVRNTIVLPWEMLLVYNGKKVDTSWDNRFAIRHTMCQVDENNFLITISTRPNLKSQHQAIQLSARCINGVNFDGGGSANVFYKNRGANSVTMIRGTTRPRPDAIYFAEY